MEKKFKKLEKEVNGITLVALVVTIIVMLILAGVAISFSIRRRWNIQKSKRRNRNLSKCKPK